MTGTIRSTSSPSQTARAPGRVELPAYVDDCRTLAGHVGARFRGRRGICELPTVRKAVGRSVDDAHHLRLIEAHRTLAEVEGGSRCRQGLPLRGHIVVEPAFDSFDRHQLNGCSAIILDLKQLDCGEPVQTAGEPRHFPVVSKRRIHEGGGTKQRAHMNAKFLDLELVVRQVPFPLLARVGPER